jgi:hypothetical protein
MPLPSRLSEPVPAGLKARVNAWVDALKACDFAGQIDLPEEDLKTLAGPVRRGFESYVLTAQNHAIRVVFSVNCAYYAQDGGFWKYLCALLGYEDTAQLETVLGRQIEESLTYFGFLGRPRCGPFRCVGPLLEQAGVTLRSMRNFTETLDHAAKGDWDRLLSLTFHQFRRVVDDLTPGTYLGLFLKDDSRTGWTFARDVARSIRQHERGLLSWQDLQQLPGYRPGFWKELKKHLEIEPSKTSPARSRRAPLPKLVFDSATQQVQLVFDHEYVERREYSFDGDKVATSRWPCISRDDFKRSYHILIKSGDETWKEFHVLGFSLEGPKSIAIFHPLKGYITPDAPVPLGPCFLLAPQGTNLPDSLPALSDFEHVSITDAAYVFWLVDVGPASDLGSLGYGHEREPEEILSWAGCGCRLAGALEPSNVFVSKLPGLRIKQARLFTQGRLALFLDTGSSPQRIPIYGESDTQDLTLPVNPGSTGLVSVEPLGRLRAADPGQYECSLTFALLPNCALHWPSGLFSLDDRPFITFDGPPQISVRLPECSTAGPGQWQIPARTAVVEGTLQLNSLSILLGHTVYRAGFAENDYPEKRFFESAEFDMEFSLCLRGIPQTPIRLGLSDSVDTVAFDLAQNFDVAGFKRLSSFAIRDPVKNYLAPAGTISIWDGRAWVASGALLLNLAALGKWLFADEQDPAPPWFRLLEDSLSVWLKEVLQAARTFAPIRPFECPNTLPLSTQKWAEEVELMLLTFAQPMPPETADPFTTRKVDHLDPELIDGLRWVWAARGLVERAKSEQPSDASTLIARYPEKWLPPRTGWRQIAENLLKALRLQQDLDLMIEAWSAEARPPMRVVLESRIATQPKGRELTDAYICSQQGNNRTAYLLTDTIERGLPSGLVLDLALLLKHLILLKSSLNFEPPAAPVHKKLEPFFLGLSQLARGQEVAPQPNGVQGPLVLNPEKLPLHPDDIALLRKAIGFH